MEKARGSSGFSVKHDWDGGAGFVDDIEEGVEHCVGEFVAIEVSGDVITALEALGTSAADVGDAVKEGLGIVGGHRDAGFALFDDPAGLATDAHDDGNVEGHVLEDFGWHDGAEEVGTLEVDEAGVAGGDDLGHFLLGEQACEPDVGESFIGGNLFEFGATCSVADDPEVDVVPALLFQHFGGGEDDFETVSHADGADVAADEAFIGPEFLTDGGSVCAGELGEIDAIGDDGNVLFGDASVEKSLAVVITDGDDVIGGLVEFFLKPFESADEEVALHGPDGDNGFGPEVADFEDEGDIFAAGEDACPAAEELGGCGDDEIDV